MSCEFSVIFNSDLEKMEPSTSSMPDKSKKVDKRVGRGVVETGLTHECGVFGVVGAGQWPTNV